MKCPKCYSTNINQFRMPTGAIWCENCGFRVEQKEIYNPFASGNYIKKFIEHDDSTWDELAKEIVKFAPQDVADFIYCLIDNSEEDDKESILNMVINIFRERNRLLGFPKGFIIDKECE